MVVSRRCDCRRCRSTRSADHRPAVNPWLRNPRLRSDLDSWTRNLASGPAADRAQVEHTLAGWRANPDLSGLRDPEALEGLPPAERLKCRALCATLRFSSSALGLPDEKSARVKRSTSSARGPHELAIGFAISTVPACRRRVSTDMPSTRRVSSCAIVSSCGTRGRASSSWPRAA